MQLPLCGECHDRSKNLRLGVDVASVSAISASIGNFGERFTRRIFTAHEIDTARGAHERLAARFAAKEATIKALDLSEIGIDWRNIEVRSDAAGRPALQLNGKVAQRAKDLRVKDIAVSLSHEADVAFAAVFVLVETDEDSVGTNTTSWKAVTHPMKNPIDTNAVEAKVREVLAKHGGLKQDIATIAADASLSDEGMTSHASVNVMLALESVFGEIPERMLTRSVFRSVSSIAQAMTEIGFR